MPRRSKGPRLKFRAARPAKRQAADWVICDGAVEIRTGCGPEQRQEAEIALGDYIAAKYAQQSAGPAGRPGRDRDPAEVLIADILNIYAAEKAPSLADPVSASYRIESLLEYWTVVGPDFDSTRDGTLADIRRSTCLTVGAPPKDPRANYVAWRTAQRRRSYKDQDKAPFVTEQAARRELEDLSAAIGWFDQDNPLTRRPVVTLPEKAESPRDALTRNQAARLLKAAMGWRWDPELVDGRTGRPGAWTRLSPSARKNRAHLRRFLMLGFYTGTRHTALLKLLWIESPTQAWIDLEQETIYRRGRLERDHKTKRRPLCRIPPRLLAHLRRWRAADARLQERLRQAHFDAGGDATTAPQLAAVIHHGCEPLAGRIRTGFEGIVRDAGLPAEITPHWMRHSCATWLMEADIPSWDAAAYMGMTTQTLEATYGHHRPNHQDRTRKAAGGRRKA